MAPKFVENLINFTLNEGAVAMSPKGNHTLAIINGTEDYNLLKISLSDLIEKVKDLYTFPIEYFPCSDLKFLAIVCGIGSASATYSCICCACLSSERHNMDKQWSFSDIDKGA